MLCQRRQDASAGAPGSWRILGRAHAARAGSGTRPVAAATVSGAGAGVDACGAAKHLARAARADTDGGVTMTTSGADRSATTAVRVVAERVRAETIADFLEWLGTRISDCATAGTAPSRSTARPARRSAGAPARARRAGIDLVAPATAGAATACASRAKRAGRAVGRHHDGVDLAAADQHHQCEKCAVFDHDPSPGLSPVVGSLAGGRAGPGDRTTRRERPSELPCPSRMRPAAVMAQRATGVQVGHP